MQQGMPANRIGSRRRLNLQLPPSQSARHPPLQWTLPEKRHQAGSGSPGTAGPDVVSSSVGPFPPSAPQPSAFHHRTPSADLSGI